LLRRQTRGACRGHHDCERESHSTNVSSATGRRHAVPPVLVPQVSCSARSRESRGKTPRVIRAVRNGDRRA
jgi:hypothetical protein